MSTLEAYFETREAARDLPRRSARAGMMMLAAQAGVFLLLLGSTAVLARLLTPRDFGLVAMAMTLINLVRTLKDAGIANAIVQHAEITHRQASSAFWMNFALTIVLAAGTAAVAPALAWFYREPILVPMTLLLTIGVFALGASALHVGLLRRQLRFGAVALIEVGAAAVGVVVGVYAALSGAGYWAPVSQILAFNLSQAAGVWLACRWRPDRPFDRLGHSDASVKSLRAYGRNVAWTQLVGYVGRNADSILVGRLAGAAALGLYDRALQWAFLPFRQISMPLVNVAVASFSRLQDDAARYRDGFRAAVRALFAVTVPAAAFLFVETRTVVVLLLGDQWLETVPLFRVLVVAAFVSTVTQLTRWIYRAEGRTRREFEWAMISTPVLMAGVVAGSSWGAMGVAIGYTAGVVALVYPALRYCLRASPVRIEDFWEAGSRAVIAAACAAAVVAVVSGVLAPVAIAPMLAIAANGVLFVSIYALCFATTAGGRRDLGELARLAAAMRMRPVV